MSKRRGPQPISDRRLAEVRREAGGFRYVLSSDVEEILARLDLAERRIAAAKALTFTGAEAQAAAAEIGAALCRRFYPEPTTLASDGDARGASPAEGQQP